MTYEGTPLGLLVCRVSLMLNARAVCCVVRAQRDSKVYLYGQQSAVCVCNVRGIVER